MNHTLLEKYAQLKLQQKQTEAQLEFLAPAVLKEVLDIYQDQPITTEALKTVGTFSIMKKKLWTFSSTVEDLVKAVEDAKKVEKANGEALCEETPVLVFREVVKEPTHHG